MTITQLFPSQGHFCDACLYDNHAGCADFACVCGFDDPHTSRPKRLTPIAASNPRPAKPSAFPGENHRHIPRKKRSR